MISAVHRPSSRTAAYQEDVSNGQEGQMRPRLHAPPFKPHCRLPGGRQVRTGRTARLRPAAARQTPSIRDPRLSPLRTPPLKPHCRLPGGRQVRTGRMARLRPAAARQTPSVRDRRPETTCAAPQAALPPTRRTSGTGRPDGAPQARSCASDAQHTRPSARGKKSLGGLTNLRAVHPVLPAGNRP